MSSNLSLGIFLILVAMAPIPSLADVSLRIDLRTETTCEGNLIRLADVATLRGSESLTQSLGKIQLGLAPSPGKSKSISRKEIEQLLALRGMNSETFHWAGADACTIRRSSLPFDTGLKFTSSRPPTSPVHEFQCRKNVDNVLRAYLRMQNEESGNWKIEMDIGQENLQDLHDRRTILGVAGGEAPWVGEQQFTLLVRTKDGEKQIPIVARIELPRLVVAVCRAFRSGELLAEEDLCLIPLPANSRLREEDCFESIEEVTGKELRRSTSTNQILSRSDIGAPRVVEPSDLVEVEVLSGGVSVSTAARCLQSGGLGDVVQVEILANKRRLMAEVMSQSLVRVVSGRGN